MSGNDTTPLDPPENDPAMDDILASIRKILKDDDSPAGLVSQALADGNSTLVGPKASGPTTAAAIAASALAFGAPPPPSPPPPAAAPPRQATGPAKAPVPAPAAAPPPPPRPAVASPPLPPGLEKKVPVPNPQMMAALAPAPVPNPTAAPPPSAGPVMNPSATAAMAASLGELVRAVAADRHVAVSRGAVTLEDIVREEMRPLIKDWLDRHLPLMVERLVRAEIERVVGRAMT